jgi:hypothetical protein
MLGLFYPYGIFLQAIAIVHFVRRRPDAFWLWVILIGGGLGALVYIVAEVIPDVGLLRGAVQVFPRRKRIKELEAIVLDNPSIGNYEELGDLYLDDGKYARARECFDRVISPRTDSPDPFYRRALSAIALNDFQAATNDLATVLTIDPKYDYHRAAGLQAHSLGRSAATTRPLPCLQTSRPCQRYRRHSTTTRVSLRRRGTRPKPVSGHGVSFRKSSRCRRICDAGSARGFGKHTR